MNQIQFSEKGDQCTINYDGKSLVIPSKELIKILDNYALFAMHGGVSSGFIGEDERDRKFRTPQKYPASV